MAVRHLSARDRGALVIACAIVQLTWVLSVEIAAQGFAPGEAEKRLQVSEGLTATVFAAEPMVRQPIFVKCDARGRLWTIQYLQYPNPAGLKRASIDRWSRTTYDRVPEPPPRGPQGADVITVLEDTDGDGRADVAKDVIRGLNLCTGLEFGHDGLFVLQVPYLLFYADRNRDDVPDGDPEVLLSGFGMEDAQSLVNHLTWGPDGWLYGVTGSTSTNVVRGLEFQQGVWRYHPRTKAFELFSEGGSNLFGLTFDARGQLFFTSNGGQLCYHGLQGAYYAKSFGKHGALHNPFAYGWFEEISKRQPQRGGPTTGGTVYLGASISGLQGRFIGGDFLGHTASTWSLMPRNGTFEADRVGTLLDPQDTWSGPTDVCFGPAGEISISDFYDRRTAHPDPDADWDRSNGRIYQLRPKDMPRTAVPDFASLDSPQLIEQLSNPNHWHRRQARLALSARRDHAAIAPLLARAVSNDPETALEAVWALHSSGQLELSPAIRLLTHESPDVRFWAIRFLGDEWAAHAETAPALLELAEREESPLVLSQLLSTAKRLPATAVQPIIVRLMSRAVPDPDKRLRWLTWWAIEAHCLQAPSKWVQVAKDANSLEREETRFVLMLLARRYAAEGTSVSGDAAAGIVRAAPGVHRAALLKAIDQGLGERIREPAVPTQGDLFRVSAGVAPMAATRSTNGPPPLTGDLAALIREEWTNAPTDPIRISLAIQTGLPGVVTAVARAAVDPSLTEPQRLAQLQSLGRSHDSALAAALLPNLQSQQPDAILVETIRLLSGFEHEGITGGCLALLRHSRPAVRDAARRCLLSRRHSTRTLFKEIEAQRLAPADVPVDDLRLVALHADPELDAFVRRHWGAVQSGTPESKLADMRRLNNDIRAAAGDRTNGKALFVRHCAACHKLFGEGGAVGPDLTNTSRADREFLLRSLVDPSAVIRSQYLSTVVATTQGQILTGLIAEQDNAQITLVDAKAERRTIPRETVESMRDSTVSIMPEGVLSQLAPQDVRDLFAYLQWNGDQP